MSPAPIKISVLKLVGITCASGDLTAGLFSPPDRTVRAIRAHQKIQKSYGEEYEAEVSVSMEVAEENVSEEPLILQVSGRIDGVLKSVPPVVEEIKTVITELASINESDNPMHWAQARCYAFIYASQNNHDQITLRLTYVQLDTLEGRSFEQTETIDELRSFFYAAVNRYCLLARMSEEFRKKRNGSIAELSFPFGAFRPGQRNFAAAVYRAVKAKGHVLAQAPTGTGKTMATLFPSIKALGENAAEKIFYLTAKGVTASLAERAIEHMRTQGLKLKSVTITAKEKICFLPKASCNPEECRYCKGYYDRLGPALMQALSLERMDRQEIEHIAQDHTLCPFELCLDISLWSDCIICDYNYAFDPSVYLRRFFDDEDEGNYVFLIDEAHNLVDRAREMFSAECGDYMYSALKKKMGKGMPEVKRSLTKIIKILKEIEESMGEKSFATEVDPPPSLLLHLHAFLKLAQKRLGQNDPHPAREQLLEVYFETLSFMRIQENYDERYTTTLTRDKNGFTIKQFCIDPSFLLGKALKRTKAAVFFSATLSPLDYFRDVFGARQDAKLIRIGSPFPEENLRVLVGNTVSTVYKERTVTAPVVASMIAELIYHQKGNYLAFFPSYEYLNQVKDHFASLAHDAEVIIQGRNMTEEDRAEFLGRFDSDNCNTLLGFAVMGGVFGEGIDLVGDKLVGAVIVGVGLPQICDERELIKDYYQKTRGTGFDFAYTFPGMNKVLQAAGRVIRTETDRGVLLLIDQRFTRYPYRSLLPQEWGLRFISSSEAIKQALGGFWL